MGGRGRGFWQGAAAGAAVAAALLLTAVWIGWLGPAGGAAQPDREDEPGEVGQPAPPPRADAVDLVDPRYRDELPGDYRQTLEADLDGDGEQERVVLRAAVERVDDPAEPGPAEFAWDDGQPWQVSVEEPAGERTVVFARWVQLGVLEVLAAEDALYLLERAGAGLAVYRVTYRGPQQARAEVVVERSGEWAQFDDTP